MRFEIYQNVKNGQWYWRRVARNGKTVADGSEGYATHAGVTRAVNAFVRGLMKQCGVASYNPPKIVEKH